MAFKRMFWHDRSAFSVIGLMTIMFRNLVFSLQLVLTSWIRPYSNSPNVRSRSEVSPFRNSCCVTCILKAIFSVSPAGIDVCYVCLLFVGYFPSRNLAVLCKFAWKFVLSQYIGILVFILGQFRPWYKQVQSQCTYSLYSEAALSEIHAGSHKENQRVAA